MMAETRRASLCLFCLALPAGCLDLHPQYFKVNGNIETLWQRPHGEPKGIFFIAHGCQHQATDVFSYVGPDGWKFEACKQSNYGDCLGLPEEVQLRQVARARGYLVVAVSGGHGVRSCWDADGGDQGKVAAAIQHVRTVEGLSSTLPVFAMGASSGGAFVGSLAAPLDAGGLPNLACIVPQIMAVHNKNRGVPALFVHMPKDRFTAHRVEQQLPQLTSQQIRSAEIKVRQRPLTLAMLGRCLPADVAQDVLTALRKADVLDSSDYLKVDARDREWVQPVKDAIKGRSSDSLSPDESCIAEEMNVAWAMHEFTAEPAEQMLDFCEAALPKANAVAAVQVLPGAALRGASKTETKAEPKVEPTVLPGTQQILVFDAGSSGTRVHIFSMVSGKPGAHVPTIKDRPTLKIKPGLSHYARQNDMEGVEKSIRQLLDFANTVVPTANRKQTPALLKATAGLRAVSESQANTVLAHVQRSLDASGYLFRPDWADIIKGKEEAGLGWVAANYLAGTFDGAGNTASTGIIELGGGSTQVSFQVDQSSQLAESDDFVFTTAVGKRYHLYAHSYLGYGQDYAQSQARLVLPKSSTSDPCYPKGYSRTNSETLTVEGSGNATSCTAHIEASLFKGAPDAPGKYKAEQPLSGKFLATQNFFFVRQNLNLPMATSSAEMEAQSQDACTRPTEKSEDPSKPNSCFGLCYQVSLLRALKVAPPRVDITNSVKGGDADWALGAALVHILEGHHSVPVESSTATGGGMSITSVLTSIVLGSLLLLLVRLTIWPRVCGPARKLATSPEAVESGGPERMKATKMGRMIRVPAE